MSRQLSMQWPGRGMLSRPAGCACTNADPLCLRENYRCVSAAMSENGAAETSIAHNSCANTCLPAGTAHLLMKLVLGHLPLRYQPQHEDRNRTLC
jgi:hypothetical protein